MLHGAPSFQNRDFPFAIRHSMSDSEIDLAQPEIMSSNQGAHIGS
jgi:hypothetical protein